MWNKLSMKDRAKYIALGVSNNITSLDTIKNTYNLYQGGGILGFIKSIYYNAKPYEANSLKEALFKAYDDGLEGKNIMYKGNPYKVQLNEADTREYNTYKQHKLNRKITPEEVVDSYINNVLYTMENPKDKGFKDGKYYPYKDISSPKNLGPGINYTSDMGKTLDFSGKTGYTKEELNAVVKPQLLENMNNIMQDLHNKYGADVDTMSMGNRQILLDISHNVRPKGKKRANMPSAWPSLTEGMVTGDANKIKDNVYSGSTRRALMRLDLLFKNIIDNTTVKNR